MNYEKPNVALVASAVEAVKGTPKNSDLNDSIQNTVAAYESDE